MSSRPRCHSHKVYHLCFLEQLNQYVYPMFVEHAEKTIIDLVYDRIVADEQLSRRDLNASLVLYERLCFSNSTLRM
jgi:hypothetical protein